MNTKIVNQLIFLNNEYEIKLENFIDKTDLSKIFEFERESYTQKLTDTIIPDLYIQLQTNPQDSVDFYLPYVKAKYHDAVRDELSKTKVNDEKRIYTIGRKISQDFTAELLIHKNLKEEDKTQFIEDFYNKNLEIFIEILDHDTPFFFKFMSDLRNPKIQYKILNKNPEIAGKAMQYLNKIDKLAFEKILRESIFYPTDIEMDDYYKKWIGKDKIHVKFLKAALADRYAYAKMFSKMIMSGKRPKLIDLN